VLKHPHWQGFVAYGAVCVKKVEALSEIILFAHTQEDPAR
jgi:hypothetical protein